MPNENKKSYKEIAENNMVPRNTLLKDVYAKLEQTPEADMQARIEEIREALLDVNNRTAKMQRRMMTKKELMEDKQAMAELEEISLIGTRLENEAEMLDYFPRVRATMQAIKSAQDKADLELTEAIETVAARQRLLKEASNAAEKALEAEEMAKKIQAQIEELITDMQEAIAKGRKPKVIEGLEEEIDEKKAEIEALGTPEEWKKAIEEEGICETKLALAVEHRNEKITEQAILANPWETIIKDYLWTEIGDLTSEDISKLVGTQVEKPEAKWEEKPVEKDDKDKDKDNDKSKGKDSGKGQNTNNSNNFPNPSGPQEPLKPAPEQKPDQLEHDEEETDLPKPPEGDPFEHDEEPEPPLPDLPKTWSEKHKIIAKILPGLARWMEKRSAKKVEEATERLSKEEKAWKRAKGELIRAESSIQATDLQIKNYEINARNAIKQLIAINDSENDEARTAKENLSSYSLETMKSVAAMYIARGDYTEEEMYTMLEQRAALEGLKKDDTYILTADRGYNDSVKNAINQQLSHLTVSQLHEREPYLEMLGVYTPEEFKDLQMKVAEREESEKAALNAKLEKARRDLIQARAAEAQAKQEYEDTKVSASRRAHRDFASQINGGETISTPEVEHVEAEIVREGDYARATSDSEPDIGDPFAEEPADAADGAR